MTELEETLKGTSFLVIVLETFESHCSQRVSHENSTKVVLTTLKLRYRDENFTLVVRISNSSVWVCRSGELASDDLDNKHASREDIYLVGVAWCFNQCLGRHVRKRTWTFRLLVATHAWVKVDHLGHAKVSQLGPRSS